MDRKIRPEGQCLASRGFAEGRGDILLLVQIPSASVSS